MRSVGGHTTEPFGPWKRRGRTSRLPYEGRSLHAACGKGKPRGIGDALRANTTTPASEKQEVATFVERVAMCCRTCQPRTPNEIGEGRGKHG